MPRVIGVDVPDNKRLIVALTYIHGVGRHIAQQIVEKLGLDPDMRARKLTEADIARLNSVIPGDYTVEGDLRRETTNNIKRLISINCYRGLRHRMGLPTRGQRTQTNARTRKGRKKTVAKKKK